MPLDEEGAKWSCEPCIRGHRSSKCQHFDRLMMKVPKAGRPLAKCPHPKGTCSCRKTYAVMVRIPKGPTCMCRPLYEVPIENESDQSSTPATMTPVTIAPAATPSSVVPTPPVPGKVQKPARRQSNIQAAPENIARALESISKAENQNSEDGVSNHLPSYISHNQGPPATYGPLGQQPPALVHNRVFDTGGTPTPQSNGCCSGKANTQPPPEQPQRQGSCCGKQEPLQDDSTKPRLGENGNTLSSAVNGTSYTPFSAPSFSSWQDYHAAGHGNLFQPFPAHQPQTQSPGYLPPYTVPHSTMSFPYQNISHNIGFTQAAMPVFPSAQFQDSPYAPPTAIEGDSGHVCKCGEGCQCLGCASHPFNNTTKQHVQEMGLLVGLNGTEQNQHSPFSRNATSTPLDYSVGMNHNLDNGLQANAMHTYSEHTPYSDHLGSGYPSHANYTSNQEEFMEPSQYYTLEYSVGLPNPCSDVTGSCQCGNDCSCIGCLTHSGHNNLGFDPISTENTGFYTPGPLVQQTGPNVPRDFSAPSPSL